MPTPASSAPAPASLADRVALARLRLSPQYLAGLTLREGSGSGREGDRCAVQEVRWALGEDPHSDAATPCMSPICRSLMISVQDARADWRAECVALLPLLPGSAGSAALELRRAHRLLDWSVREAMPAAIDVLVVDLAPHDAGLAETLRGHAATLRALVPIVDEETRFATRKAFGARARDLARALAHDLACARALARDQILSPVALLRELLEMRDASEAA